MTDLRPTIDPFFGIFGVPATVTPTGGAPVVTTIVWEGMGAVSPDGELAADQPRRHVRLRRDEVPVLYAHRATILAPQREGAAVETWKADAVEELDDQVLRVAVLRVA